MGFFNLIELQTRPVAQPSSVCVCVCVCVGGGGRWRPKRGPSRVGWCVCVGGGEGITIVSGPGVVVRSWRLRACRRILYLIYVHHHNYFSVLITVKPSAPSDTSYNYHIENNCKLFSNLKTRLRHTC